MSKDYFIYKGVIYGRGTKVRMTDVFHKRYSAYYYSDDNEKYMAEFQIQRKRENYAKLKQKIYSFNYGTEDENVFLGDCGNFGVIDPDEEIAEIVEPVYVKLVPWQKQAVKNIFEGKVYADVFGGVLIYIVVMLVGAIFVDRWLIWIGATAIFIGWLLHQYRT